METAIAISITISAVSLIVSVISMNIAVRNPEVHIYHEPEDKNQHLS